MARNYNKVIIIGKVESEIILRQTTNKTPVTNFTVTTSNKWTDKNGEIKEYKKWHHIVCWGKVAEQVVNLFIPGDDVLIEGSIKVSTKDLKSFLSINGRTITLLNRNTDKQHIPSGFDSDDILF